MKNGESLTPVHDHATSPAQADRPLVRATDLASGLVGAVIKDPTQDQVAWAEYLETVVKERDGWKDLYRACKEQR